MEKSKPMERSKQKMYLKPEALLKFFLEADDKIDTLIKCKGSEIELVTYDHDLYEALGSLKDYDSLDVRKLIKFFEVVDIISYRKSSGKEKPILTHERVEQLRRLALDKEEKKES